MTRRPLTKDEPVGNSRAGRYIADVPTSSFKTVVAGYRRGQAGRAARTLLVAGLLLVQGLAVSSASAAPKVDLDDPLLEADGRLRGYTEDTTAMVESSTFLTYGLLIGLSLFAAGVMFKASKRSHLD